MVTIGGVAMPVDCEQTCQDWFTVSNRYEFRGFSIDDMGRLDGRGTISNKGEVIKASFSNSFFTTSPILFFDKYAYGKEVDKFEGKLKTVYDPFWKVSYETFHEGTYTMWVGAKFNGHFFLVPKFDFWTGNGCIKKKRETEVKRADTMAVVVDFVKSSNVNQRMNCVLTDLVFVGELEYKDKTQIGVFSQKNYKPGSRLQLSQTNEDSLKVFESENEKVFKQFVAYIENEERRVEAEKQRYDIPWGKIFSVLAGAVITTSSGLSDSQKVDFFSSYTKDVFSNSTKNMNALKSKYANHNGIDNNRNYDPFKVIRELNANTDRMIADYNASRRVNETAPYGCKESTVWNVQAGRCVTQSQVAQSDSNQTNGNYYRQSGSSQLARDNNEIANNTPRQWNADVRSEETNRNQRENKQLSSEYEGKIYAIVPAYERGKQLPASMQDWKTVVEDPSFFPARELTKEGTVRPGLWYYFSCTAEWTTHRKGNLIPGRVNGTFYTGPQATGLASRPSKTDPWKPKNIWHGSYTGKWLLDRFSEQVKQSINSGNMFGVDLKDAIKDTASTPGCQYIAGFTKEEVDEAINKGGYCKLGKQNRDSCYHVSFDGRLENQE